MQAWQPVVVVALALDGLVVAVVDAGAPGLEVRALVAQAGDETPVTDVHGVHEVAGVDVFVHAEVIDGGGFLVVVLRRIQPADQALDRVGGDALAELLQAVVHGAVQGVGEVQLVVAQAGVGEVLVLPDLFVVVLGAPAELAAEFEGRRVAGQVVVAGQVQTQVLLVVRCVGLAPLDLVQAELTRVVERRVDVQAWLLAVVPALSMSPPL